MFRFRLETLLGLRIAERDERRADLAKALRAEALLREQERRIEQEQLALAARTRQLKSPGQANVDSLLHTHRYELVLAAQRRQLAGQIGQILAEVERRRQALMEADRQVRVLEKLRDKQAAAHRLRGERLEAKELDEIASLGHVRSRRIGTEAPSLWQEASP